MNRLTITILLALTLAGLVSWPVLAGGGQEAPKTDKPIEIVWWGFDERCGQHVKESLKMLQGHGQLINVQVTTVVYGYEELYDKLLAVFAAGGAGAPDLVDVEISSAGRFYKQEPIGFHEITDLVKGSRYYEDQIIKQSAPYLYKGKLYGLDTNMCLSMLYYRKDIFDQYNISMPLATWDDYIKAGLELKKHGIYLVEVPNGANPDNFNEDFIPQLLFQQGGGYFDKSGKIIVNNEIGVRTIEFVNDMVNKYEVAMASAADIFDPPFYVPYKQDKVATMIMPVWMLDFFMVPNMPEQAGKWRIAPLPVWGKAGRKTSSAGGTALMITKFTKSLDAAWKILEENRMSPEGGRLAYELLGYYPPIKSVLNDPSLIKGHDYLGGQSVGEFVKTYAGDIPQYYLSPYWWDAHLLMASEVLYPVLSRKISPKEGLNNMAKRLQDMMK